MKIILVSWKTDIRIKFLSAEVVLVIFLKYFFYIFLVNLVLLSRGEI